MHKVYVILLFVMLACLGCEWRLRNDLVHQEPDMFVERYDKIEAFFLTTGDFSALQQMQTQYPLQTRRLIEDVLRLGKMEDAYIKTRFFNYYQDSTLQTLIAEVAAQYGEMDDVDRRLEEVFTKLHSLVPEAKIPHIYTQIGSLDQSICVGDGVLGISLDKYLGVDYPLYIKYGYTERQRNTMMRSSIAPDCLCFYLLSLFPFKDSKNKEHRDIHMGRIQYVANVVLEEPLFKNDYVDSARQEMDSGELTYSDLLRL